MPPQAAAALLRIHPLTLRRLMRQGHLQAPGGDIPVSAEVSCRHRSPAPVRWRHPPAPQAEVDAAVELDRAEWAEVLLAGWGMGEDASEEHKRLAWRLAGNFM
jgi:hypothetical protein